MDTDSAKNWNERYAQWLDFVKKSAQSFASGARIPVGPSQPPLLPAGDRSVAAGATKILLCSPHPDDEALIGALPLRMRLEAGACVVNCAITFGSDEAQKPRRLRELEASCRVLGFELLIPKSDAGPLGFDHVNVETRTRNAREWSRKVESLAKLFARENPDAVFAPHAEDFNTTHIGTHYLVADALKNFVKASGRESIAFLETEYWHQMFAPNLMVGVTPEVVAIQLMATAEHGGEVSRNPYHLRQPARMMDNVRRGSEVVGGQGGNARAFTFAELYRVSFATAAGITAAADTGLVVGPEEKCDLATLISQFR